ncbi:MAG: GIY-YIG nuclease family protein [Methanobacteriota archaeon]|nr:MAG: GIY-YIG nuclease family protein [Euryarchaeota archaeon]
MTGEKGTYILILFLARFRRIFVGKLGEICFKDGYYAYIGSALGPGGVKARCRHHLAGNSRPHWHIDFLSNQAKIVQIWYVEHPHRFEHEWSNLLSQCEAVKYPIIGFGTSDCQCPTHLFYLNHPYQLFLEFKAALEARFSKSPSLKIYIPHTV